MPHKIQKTDLAWMAGIVDGEGCYHANLCTGPGGKYLGLYLKVVMADKKAIQKVRAIAGMGTFTKRGPYTSNRRALYVWQTTSQQAVAVTKRILPYLVTKHEQACTFMVLAKESHLRKSGRLTKEIRKWQRMMVARLKKMKTKN